MDPPMAQLEDGDSVPLPRDLRVRAGVYVLSSRWLFYIVCD